MECIKNLKFYLNLYTELYLIKSIAEMPAKKFVDYYFKQAEMLGGKYAMEALHGIFLDFLLYLRNNHICSCVCMSLLNWDANSNDEKQKKDVREQLLALHELIRKYWKNYVKDCLDKAEKNITNSINSFRRYLLEK